MRTTDPPADRGSSAPRTAPEQDQDEDRPGPAIDRVTLLGFAITLFAIGALGIVLATAMLLGALWIAGSVLLGAGAGALVLLLPRPRRPGVRRALASGTVVLVAVSLVVPIEHAHRADRLQDLAGPALPVLREGDRATTIPDPATDSPILLRRQDGSAQLLGGSPWRSTPLRTGRGETVVLSSDGETLIRADSTSTTVQSLGDDLELGPGRSFTGTPLALADSVLVVTDCEDGPRCWQSGYDLAATPQDPEEPEPLWSVQVDADAPGTIAPGSEVDPSSDLPTPEATLRRTGLLPDVILRWDHQDGWDEVDPRTGFPQGDAIASADCAVAADHAPVGRSGIAPGPVVLSVCTSAGGALTARATRKGEEVWAVDASPPGDWTYREGHARVVASGTTAEGRPAEIVAAEVAASWTPVGGELARQVNGAALRLAADGADQVVVTTLGQLTALDTATGSDLWTASIRRPSSARAVLGNGGLVVLDPQARSHALSPRGAVRLRVFDATTGGRQGEITLTGAPQVVPLGAGRVLLSGSAGTRLLRTG